jgi:protein AaeX
MIKEIDLFGVYVPPMFAYAAAAALIWLVLRQCLTWAGAYRVVWHPALFNTALYALVLSLCITFVFR